MLPAPRRPPPATVLALLALSWAFATTVARTVRFPNDWAEAHWLISYEFGFLKRALPGTLILPLRRVFGRDPTELVIAIVSLLIFAAFCAALGGMLHRILSRHRFSPNSVLLALVVVTSSYVVMGAHLVGYFDHVLVVLTVAACACVLRGRTTCAAGLVCLGALIHETIFVVGYPSVLLTALLVEREPAAGLAERLKRGFPLLALPAMVVLGLVVHQSLFLDADSVRVELQEYLEGFAFVRRHRHIHVPVALTTSFGQYLHAQSEGFWDRLTSWPDLRSKIGPLLALVLAGGISLRDRARTRWLLPAFTAVTLSPLLLFLIAYDMGRIWSYPILVALVGLWTIAETAPRAVREPIVPRWTPALLVALLAANVVLTTHLMDKLDERLGLAARLALYAPVLAAALWIAATTFRSRRGAAIIRPPSDS